MAENRADDSQNSVPRLLARHEAAIRRILERRSGSRILRQTTVEDLYQETIAAALASADSFQYVDDARFLGWISTIARRTIARQLGTRYQAFDPLRIRGGEVNSRNGEAVVQGFNDDYFMVQATISGGNYIWVHYQDPNNGYRIVLRDWLAFDRIQNGQWTRLADTAIFEAGPTAIKIKITSSGGSQRFRVWGDGALHLDVTTSTFLTGGVAFGGDDGATFDDCKIGYDNNGDNDIDDAGDDLVWNESFGGTSKSPLYDHAGNMIGP